MAKKQPVPPKSAPHVGVDAESDEQQEPDPRPLYKLAAPAYHDDVYYAEGDKMHFDGVPAWYMKPVDAKARELVKKHWPNGQEQPDGLAMLSHVTSAGMASSAASLKS